MTDRSKVRGKGFRRQASSRLRLLFVVASMAIASVRAEAGTISLNISMLPTVSARGLHARFVVRNDGDAVAQGVTASVDFSG